MLKRENVPMPAWSAQPRASSALILINVYWIWPAPTPAVPVDKLITFQQKDATKLENPLPEGPKGTIISKSRRTASGWRANWR